MSPSWDRSYILILANSHQVRKVCAYPSLFFEGRVFCADLLAKEKSFSSQAYSFNWNHRETLFYMQANWSPRMEAISCFQEPIMRLGKKSPLKFSNFTKEIIELKPDKLESVFPVCPTF